MSWEAWGDDNADEHDHLLEAGWLTAEQAEHETKRNAFYRQEWKKTLTAHIMRNSTGSYGQRMPMTGAEAAAAAEKMIEEKITAWEESQ